MISRGYKWFGSGECVYVCVCESTPDSRLQSTFKLAESRLIEGWEESGSVSVRDRNIDDERFLFTRHKYFLFSFSFSLDHSFLFFNSWQLRRSNIQGWHYIGCTYGLIRINTQHESVLARIDWRTRLHLPILFSSERLVRLLRSQQLQANYWNHAQVKASIMKKFMKNSLKHETTIDLSSSVAE